MVSITGVDMVANFPRQDVDTTHLTDMRKATIVCQHFSHFTVPNIKQNLKNIFFSDNCTRRRKQFVFETLCFMLRPLKFVLINISDELRVTAFSNNCGNT
jgi:hypothetical protein